MSMISGFDCLAFVNGEFSPADSALTGWEFAATTHGARLSPSPMAPPLLILSRGGEASQNPVRLQVNVSAGAQATVLEHRTGGSGESHCEIHVKEGGRLEWVRWQHDLKKQSAAQKIVLDQEARLNWLEVQLDCQMSQSPVDVCLSGERSAAHMRGLTFGQQSQQIETRVCVRHEARETQSSQMFKSVLRDQSRNIFAGKIVITPDGQKADARQKHQSLNFHSSAQSITRPELEVEADDVKAAHGATVGRLDEDELFYLQTRGIPRDQGTALLARAFVEEILAGIESKSIYQFVDGQLNQNIAVFLAAMEKRT